MKVLNINGTLIRADRITGFSELISIYAENSNYNWNWGFKVYTTTEITIRLKYSTNSDKAMANIDRNIIIDQWKEYLRKEANEIRNKTSLWN